MHEFGSVDVMMSVWGKFRQLRARRAGKAKKEPSQRLHRPAGRLPRQQTQRAARLPIRHLLGQEGGVRLCLCVWARVRRKTPSNLRSGVGPRLHRNHGPRG